MGMELDDLGLEKGLEKVSVEVWEPCTMYRDMSAFY